jgi:hypothetical protein
VSGLDHHLVASFGSDSVAMSCDDCTYSFISPTERGRIDLSNRVWFERGDRSVNHVFMLGGIELTAMITGSGED